MLTQRDEDLTGYPAGLLPSLDVELEFGPLHNAERELIQGIQAPYLVFTTAQEIAIAPLLQLLKTLGYPISNSMVSYYSIVAGLYVYCGNDPLHNSITVPLYEFSQNRVTLTQLRLRCREVMRNEFGSVMSVGQGLPLPFKALDVPRSPPLRRTKERKIGYIIDKVMEWRTLYNGTTNSEGEEVKCTLEQAASEVSISKKSLDDYLLQLRCFVSSTGKKYGFNFQEHREDKVGVLRAYVKKYKNIETLLKKDAMNQEDIQELAREVNSENVNCKRQRCCVPPPQLQAKINEVLNYRQ